MQLSLRRREPEANSMFLVEGKEFEEHSFMSAKVVKVKQITRRIDIKLIKNVQIFSLCGEESVNSI